MLLLGDQCSMSKMRSRIIPLLAAVAVHLLVAPEVSGEGAGKGHVGSERCALLLRKLVDAPVGTLSLEDGAVAVVSYGFGGSPILNGPDGARQVTRCSTPLPIPCSPRPRLASVDQELRLPVVPGASCLD